MRRAAIALTGILVGFAVPGCLLFRDDLDYLSEGATADGGTTEAAPDSPTETGPSDGDASADAADDNLFPNPTLDESCDPLAGFQGTVTPDARFHGDAGSSCRLCTDPGANTLFSADDKGFMVPVRGKTYRAEVWVRAADPQPSPGQVDLSLRAIQKEPFQVIEQSISNTAGPVGTTWQLLTTTLTLTKDAPLLNVVVGGPYSANVCLLFDDIRVVEQ